MLEHDVLCHPRVVPRSATTACRPPSRVSHGTRRSARALQVEAARLATAWIPVVVDSGSVVTIEFGDRHSLAERRHSSPVDTDPIYIEEGGGPFRNRGGCRVKIPERVGGFRREHVAVDLPTKLSRDHSTWNGRNQRGHVTYGTESACST